ncbi:MAG: ABC transporter substrate-binding protein [Spirochaetales bacterium]|nr:ABC transporter substrate-binding protein [Spirochaetales bacterium]
MKNSALVVLLIASAALPALTEASRETAPARKQPACRIVTGGKAHSLVLDALYMFPEAYDCVVAFGSGSQAGGSFVSVVDPGAARRAVLAPEPGVEEILSHRPDCVVLKSYLAGGLGRRLEELDVPVLYVDLESPESFQRDILALGRLMGNPDRARELNAYFAENLRQVREMSGAIPASQRPATLLIYYGTRGSTVSFNVPPKQWLQTSLVQWAGGNPVWLEAAAGSGWQQVGFEQIAAWNPAIILLVSYHTPADEVKKRLLGDPKWLELEAVRQGRLFAFPADYLSWDQPDPRWIIGLHWLAGKLHPQRSDSPDIEGKVEEFYGFVYGLSRQQIRQSIIPRIRGDYP